MRHGIFLGLLLVGAVVGAWTPERWFESAKSSRTVGYRIRAVLDWPRKSLQGEASISWRNDGLAPTQEVPLHLYLNAFKGPRSLFAKEGGWEDVPGMPGRKTDARTWGYTILKDARLEGHALQGHFGEDETVYWLRLPRAVPPGETIQLSVTWETRFPRIALRSGWSGGSPEKSRFLMAGQWFPKVGVYQGSQWSCHAYHADTEFFSDFGNYDVELWVPPTLRLAHTGTRIGESGAPDAAGNVRWNLHAEDVSDFAWAAAPTRDWDVEDTVYRGVRISYYHPAGGGAGLGRQREAVQAALRHAAEWYFPYPYPVLSVVDPPPGAEGAEGMEYPTLFTAAARSHDSWGLRGDLGLPGWPGTIRGGPEQMSVHEFGHQYFQGMLGSNEVEEPWLDEGFASWFTHKVLERDYQALFASRRFQASADFMELADYWSDPSVDPVTQIGFQMRDPASYARSAYAKPVLVLNQLEATLGRPVMERVMKAYTAETAFKHPGRADFRRIAERVSGRDLADFWRDFVDGTDVLDVAIHDVGVREMEQGGWVISPDGPVFVPPQPDAPGRKGTITLVRRGGICRPMTLWVRLENRLEYRMIWDGRDRWTTYEFDAPIAAAVLDPDGQYPILKDRLHASYTSRPSRKGFHYWSQLLWGALTALLQGAGIG